MAQARNRQYSSMLPTEQVEFPRGFACAISTFETRFEQNLIRKVHEKLEPTMTVSASLGNRISTALSKWLPLLAQCKTAACHEGVRRISAMHGAQMQKLPVYYGIRHK